MKKIYIGLLLIVCAVFNNCKAQYVTIPDTAFVTWLQVNYPDCMNGNQLDISCDEVWSATSMMCYGYEINDLTGVQYFTNLDSLDCSNNNIINIPAFPPYLQYINCQNNQLDSLPALPYGLGTLICDINNLRIVPNLPEYLQYLDCSNNFLDSLPSLPPNLNYLTCYYDYVTSIPELPSSLLYLNCDADWLFNGLPVLPQGLQYLDCSNAEISNLPDLPAALQTLYCDGNELYNLPALPGGVQYIDCSYNLLATLPTLPTTLDNLSCDANLLDSLPALPVNLQYLSCGANHLSSLPPVQQCWGLNQLGCGNNQLTALPALPQYIQWLSCDHNHLTSLPSLPSILDVLYCNSNNLTALPPLHYFNTLDCDSNPNLTCLPQLGTIISLSFLGTGVVCLPDYGTVTYSTPPLSSLPLCGVFNPDGCQAFWNISGRSYYDENNDCAFDSIDVGTNYIKMQLYSGGVLQQQVYTGGLGYYSFNGLNQGSSYRVATDTSVLPFVIECPASDSYTDTLLPADSFSYNNNFAFKCRTEGFDIGVQSLLNSYDIPRRGATITMYNLAGDLSQLYGAHCASGISGQVQFIYSGQLAYTGPAAGALPPSSVNGDTISWSIADFGTVNIYTAFNLVFKISDYAIPGTQACFMINVTPVEGDYNPGNNSGSFCITIVDALDPNEKEVSPAGNIDTSSWLTYTIRFQNTGTAPAVDVRITDSLDSHLDPSTFQLLAYSAKNLTQIFGNLVVFNFPNINLPDSATSDSASRGYVQFKIKLRSNAPSGTSIQNTADIYFDLNPAVVTNTTNNILCSTSYVDTFVSITCGDSVSFNGSVYYLSGNYGDTLLSSQGCDSIITLHLAAIGDTINQSGGLCAGDSFYFYGNYIHAPGYYDTLLAAQSGCDTLATLSLVAQDPLPPMHIYDTICQGSSLAFNGGFIDTAGTYSAHFSSHNGCDSLVVLQLVVSLPPVVSLSWSAMYLAGQVEQLFYPGDTGYCSYDYPLTTISLFGGTPSGGVFTGNGVSGNAIYYDSLNPPITWSGPYWDTISYTVSQNGCNATSSDALLLLLCEGINDVNADNLFMLYPNPAKDYVIVETNREAIGSALQITDVTGREVAKLQVTGYKLQVNTNGFAAGVYFVKLSDSSGRSTTKKLVVE